MDGESVVEGWVGSFMGGLGQEGLTVHIETVPTGVIVQPTDPESCITFDGRRIATASELSTALLRFDASGDADNWVGVWATLYPRVERYGAATKAEFVIRARRPKR